MEYIVQTSYIIKVQRGVIYHAAMKKKQGISIWYAPARSYFLWYTKNRECGLLKAFNYIDTRLIAAR